MGLWKSLRYSQSRETLWRANFDTDSFNQFQFIFSHPTFRDDDNDMLELLQELSFAT
ncbi:hypothetical protein FIBSPDRAFT_857985 [Athelia psychrophila]|uniref:Uncharacterized protein n=1 Tax=Athelia psychrophila TaxID=1759441 RepID=A0A166MBT7_9AGAM|nr:hypothetical protein FIBSPDRAFT_857981 [Fibularhizoctonia sp. CBS 109695]KZP23836.1 hypothetical protein FIBSPDRAFT_857985 [Fibularhizoctonia sp. CBS 109695]